jgi:Polyketide cyclase / dehydrase and lipid transport
LKSASAEANASGEEANMTHVTHLAHYDAPPAVVRRRSIDPTLMPRYWPQMKKVWDIRGDQDAPGDSFRFRQHLLGRDVDGTSEVVAIDERTYDTLTTYDNGSRVRWKMTMTPRDRGTDVLNEIDYEVPHGLLYTIAGRLVLKRTLLGNLRRVDRAFNEIVRAEAARAS